MSSIRERAAAAGKPRKKVVKPVLTNPFELPWPTISTAAQDQIQAALFEVLAPIVRARLGTYSTEVSKGLPPDDLPVASTSNHVQTSSVPRGLPQAQSQRAVRESAPQADQEPQTDSGLADPSDMLVDANPEANASTPVEPISKRAKRRAKALTRLEVMQNKSALGTHEVVLRSGKAVHVPNGGVPEAFANRLRLDKGKAAANRPDILAHTVIGLNTVTRALEDGISQLRSKLTGQPAAGHSKLGATGKDSLRLTVAAPTRSTRLQRRATRERMKPAAKTERLARLRNCKASIPEMPATLTGVPFRDAGLLYALEQIIARVENVITGQTNKKAVETMRRIWNIISGDTASTSSDDQGSANQQQPEPKQGSHVTLPTLLLESLLFQNAKLTLPDDRDKSILISLLSRYDAAWFRAKNAQILAKATLASAKNSSKHVHTVAKTELKDSKVPTVEGAPLQLIFVAKEDINPPHLIQHLATAAAAYNSIAGSFRSTISATNASENQQETQTDAPPALYLVPLAKGAELKLAQIFALRRLSVLAMAHNDLPDYAKLLKLVQTHLGKSLSAQWLVPALNGPIVNSAAQIVMLPTHIKHLNTSAPADIKSYRNDKKETAKRKANANDARAESVKKSKQG